MVTNYEVLENTDTTTAIKINVAAYTASIVRDSRPKTLIAFNTNFFWNKVPVGLLSDGPKVIFTYPSRGVRPLLQINQLLFEAGPLLIKNGLPYWRISFGEGQFNYDVLRKTSHIAAGYTSANKLIVVYKKDTNMIELTNYLLVRKCIYGINLDGGSSAYLKAGNIRRGAYKITVGVGLD